MTCDYIFGNLPDMRRHLKVKHCLHLEDSTVLERICVNQVTRIQYSPDSGYTTTEVQVTAHLIHSSFAHIVVFD